MTEGKPLIDFYAERYGPAYKVAKRLMAIRGPIAGLTTLGVILSLCLVAATGGLFSSMGLLIGVAMAMFTIAIGVLIITILTIAASLLRIYIDVAIDLAPGLEPQDRLDLMQRW